MLMSLELPPTTAPFVLHFGEMGFRWGINRSVGQIYALLFPSGCRVNVDGIVAQFGFPAPTSSWG